MFSKGQTTLPETSAFYVELNKLDQIQDFEKAIKLCNKILNSDPHDVTAFHCKIVYLIRLEKFQDALKQIWDLSNICADGKLCLRFEESYCFYRLDNFDKALHVIEGVPQGSRQLRHKELHAQILYRLERYDECYSVYRDIIKNSQDDDEFESERLTNLVAVCVQLRSSSAPLPEEESTYEMAYNKGCAFLANKRWHDAECALRKAEDMCRKDLAEDQEETDVVDRVTGIIRVQLAFALQMIGGETLEKEAQNIYNAVLRTKPDDIGLVAVASNNLVVLNRGQNIFDSKKRLKAATAEGLEHKLTKNQRAAISKNFALLAMYTNQVEVCRKACSEMRDRFEIPYEVELYIMAGVLSRVGKYREAVELLGCDNIVNPGEGDLERFLTAAQILVEKGAIGDAITLLGRLRSEEKYRAGILSALVTMCLANKDRMKAAQLLKEAVSFKKSTSEGSKGHDMPVIWRKTAEFHLKGDDPLVAAQSLEKLLKIDTDDKQTLAQLVLAYAKFDLKKALNTSKKLPAFSYDSAIDIEALELSAFMSSKYGKKTPKTPGGMASPTTNKDNKELLLKRRRRRKTRRKRLPKNYNPREDPDPERWMPRRERTGYRKSKKDRRKGMEKFTGAQGTSVGQAEQFDYAQKKTAAAAAAAHLQKSPSAVASTPVGPRQQQRKPQQKKRKGKQRF